jgi:hypothetical protein
MVISISSQLKRCQENKFMKVCTFQSAISKVFLFVLGVLFAGIIPVSAQTAPNFGPNVFIIDPSMSASAIQSQLTSLSNEAQFSTNRYAVLFKPGTYNVSSLVGFYESIAGLGQTPDAVVINGSLTVNQVDSGGNVTTNFWRSEENLSMVPTGGQLQWAVAQGAAFRRMHITGKMELANTFCGFASGGFISDTQVSGQVNSCSQQQWYTRNSSIGSWGSGVWNMVFSGVAGAPAQSFPTPPYTTLATTPVSRERPFLYIDSNGNYNVFVPAVQTNSSGTTWAGGGMGPGTSLPISTFFIAQPTTPVDQINAALASGSNLILAPGIYPLTAPINVTNPDTIVLGLGYATLVPQNGTAAMTVADVDGVQVAGLIMDGGPVTSPVLLQVGAPNGTRVSHQSNPTSINDVFFRIGGATAGSAVTSFEVDSNNVILDNIWAWRADHGNGVGWTQNTGAHGLVVNGDNVTALGLAVEHYQQNQVVWNGDSGETIFYQSELPYDVPSQSAWMNGSANGYSSYSVSDSVLNHVGYGIGVYSFFNQGVPIIEDSAITVPNVVGVTIHDAVSVLLNGSGQITHIVDNAGTLASVSGKPQYLVTYGGVSCTVAGTTCPPLAAPTNLSATATSSSQINLSWTASTAAGVTYSVFRSTTPGFAAGSGNQIASGLTGTSYSDTGLTAATTYYYVVEASSASGASPASLQASATTQAGTPAAPANLSATAASATQINLTWTASTTAGVTYSVFRSTTPGFAAGSGNQIASGLSGTSYSDMGLTAATTYYYLVKANNSSGSSLASNQASATTLGGATIIAINSGGPAVGIFSADMDFVHGSVSTTTAAIDTSHVQNPAPQAVYQTGRTGASTYTIPHLTPGVNYTVTLHFAEIFWAAAGKREFNVLINGATVLTNFDVFASAGGKNIAIVRIFTATAASNGTITIQFATGAADLPKVSGIVVQ